MARPVMPAFEPCRLAARWIGWSPIRIWGLLPVERLRRTLTRAGLWDCGPWTGSMPLEPPALLLLRGDHVYDEALIHGLQAAKAAAGWTLASWLEA